MAKRNPEPVGGTDKAKVRVFFAEVEGNNDSVQEALKTMVSAMSRPVRVVSNTGGAGRESALLHQTDLTEDVEEAVSDAEEHEAESASEDVSSSRRPRGTGKKTDRNAGIELVPNLEFRPSGKQSLKEFVDAKAPKNDLEAVVAVTHYMQHTMTLPKIGPNHVMTAFRDIGRAIPVDLKQTIRNVKKTKAWLSFSDIEDIKMTTQGDNLVMHDMGASE